MHHHIESIIFSCLESKSDAIVDHLLRECDLIGKILQTDKHPILSVDVDKVDRCNNDFYTLMLIAHFHTLNSTLLHDSQI